MIRGMRVLHTFFRTAIVALAAVALVVASSAFAAPSGVSTKLDRTAFRGAMAKYWEDHITWTRLFIVSDLTDAPDLPQTTQRLLQNQVDIGNAIKPFYGDAAGDQLTALLTQHILIAADLVSAAKTNDQSALTTNMQKWQANADDIADFLSSANPQQWPRDEMRAMMRQHLDLTTAEVLARLNKDWSGDVAAYDRVHLHILVLSDMLGNGIEAQFPTAFQAEAS